MQLTISGHQIDLTDSMMGKKWNVLNVTLII